MFVLNYFQSGGGRSGSSHSTNIGCCTFDNKIDFDFIRENAKEIVLETMESNCPCMSEMKMFFTIVRIENDKVTGSYTGNVKSLKVLKWNPKRKENNARTKVQETKR